MYLCRGGVLYLQAVDNANSYKPAKRDRITLDATKLKDAQGVYTCPAAPQGSKPDFHCCLELQETQVLHQVRLHISCELNFSFDQGFDKIASPTIRLETTFNCMQGALGTGLAQSMPEFTLSFQPPLTIRNCLPCEITITLTDSSARPQHFDVGVGGSIEVYSYDMSRKIHMAMQLQVCFCQLCPFSSSLHTALSLNN